MITRVKNGRIISDGQIKDAFLYIKGDSVLSVTESVIPFDRDLDAEGRFIAPGFVDIHTHGGGGSDFMDGGTEPIINGVNSHLSHGTTSILPTSLACSLSTLLAFLDDVKEVMEKGLSKGRVHGVHLEGPYFALKQSGAQNPEYITAPKKEDYEKILERYSAIIKRWSFAPELEGAEDFCKALVRAGVSPSIAHSDAVLYDVERIMALGCKTITHLYSSTSTITRKEGHRILGINEAAYLYDDIDCEIIADGVHLPPPLLKIIVKNIGVKRLALVTDSMRAAGESSGESLLGRLGEGLPCVIEDGVAKLMDKTAFAGSVATTDRLLKTMVEKAGCSLPDAVKMLTENPARIAGLERVGALKEGYFADFVLLNDNLSINSVFVGGEKINIK